MAAAAPVTVRRRTAKQNNIFRRADLLEDLDIILLDLDGIGSRHVFRNPPNRQAIEESPEYITHRLRRQQVTPSRETHELQLIMFHGNTIVCSMTFTPRATPGSHFGYISNLECMTPNARVNPRSYVLFYTMAQIVRKIGVSYMHTATLGEHYYRLVKTLGFHPVEEMEARSKRPITTEKGKQRACTMIARVSDRIEVARAVFH